MRHLSLRPGEESGKYLETLDFGGTVKFDTRLTQYVRIYGGRLLLLRIYIPKFALLFLLLMFQFSYFLFYFSPCACITTVIARMIFP